MFWKGQRHEVTTLFSAEYFMVPAAVFQKYSNLPGFDDICINICNLPGKCFISPIYQSTVTAVSNVLYINSNSQLN